MKRQTFYIRADLFEVRISPRAKLILAYLFRVSDRQGRSHPSVSTVAYRCGCCPNSARKALHELEGGPSPQTACPPVGATESMPPTPTPSFF